MRRSLRTKRRRNPTGFEPDHDIWLPPGIYDDGDELRDQTFAELLWIVVDRAYSLARGRVDDQTIWWYERGPAEHVSAHARRATRGWRIGPPAKTSYFEADELGRPLVSEDDKRRIGLSAFVIMVAMLDRFREWERVRPRKSR